MRILLDVDGVVADLMTVWLKRYNTEYSDTLTAEQIVEWGIDKMVKPECGIKIFDYLWEDDLYYNVKPLDGALSSVWWMRSKGYEIVYVTSGIQPAKVEWLAREGFLDGSSHDWRTAKDVVIAQDKSLIQGDIIIDDYPKNLAEFLGKRCLLFDQPWNRSDVNYYRVKSWPDVVAYISKL